MEGDHSKAQPLFFGHAVLLQYRHLIPSEEGYSFTKMWLTANINEVTSNIYMICKAIFPTGGWACRQTPTLTTLLTSHNSTSLQNMNGNFLNFSQFMIYSNNAKHKQQCKTITKLPTCWIPQLPPFCWKENCRHILLHSNLVIINSITLN